MEGRFANLAAAVLVGGRSSRMGRDKASLETGGATLLERTLNLVAPFTSEVLVVGGVEPEAIRSGAPAHRTIPDPPGPECALRGIVGALGASDREYLWILAVDMPRLRPELLLALLAQPESDAVVPRTDGMAHPLCALYRRESALSAARECLGTERLALRDWLAHLDTTWLEGDDLESIDPGGSSLTNVNTLDDWERVGRAG